MNSIRCDGFNPQIEVCEIVQAIYIHICFLHGFDVLLSLFDIVKTCI